MEINVKKTFLLVIDKDQKRRKETPAPELDINGERLRTMNLDEACRYLGYWGTRNGDMSVTKKVVREKAETARDLIKSNRSRPNWPPNCLQAKKLGRSDFRQPLLSGRKASWTAFKKSGCRRTRMHDRWHGQRQTPYTPFQPQKQVTSSRSHLGYSCKPNCSMQTSVCDTKMCQNKSC